MLDSWLAPHHLQWLLQGFGVTIALTLCAGIPATLLGFVLCVARLAPSRWLSWPVMSFMSLLRNTPLLAQLFFWYFGVASLLPDATKAWLNASHRLELVLFDLRWPPYEYLAAFIALTTFTSVFIAEEFRAGVRAVGAGQRGAAAAIGLTPRQAWRWVVLPQALRNAFQPLVGQWLNLVKNSSLTMAIGVAEISYRARQVETETFRAFEAFAVATLLYLLLALAMESGGHAWQRRHWHWSR